MKACESRLFFWWDLVRPSRKNMCSIDCVSNQDSEAARRVSILAQPECESIMPDFQRLQIVTFTCYKESLEEHREQAYACLRKIEVLINFGVGLHAVVQIVRGLPHLLQPYRNRMENQRILGRVRRIEDIRLTALCLLLESSDRILLG